MKVGEKDVIYNYDTVYSSPWATHIDYEARHRKITEVPTYLHTTFILLNEFNSIVLQVQSDTGSATKSITARILHQEEFNVDVFRLLSPLSNDERLTVTTLVRVISGKKTAHRKKNGS